MLKYVKENMFLMNEQVENLSRKKENPLDGLNIKMAMTESVNLKTDP